MYYVREHPPGEADRQTTLSVSGKKYNRRLSIGTAIQYVLLILLVLLTFFVILVMVSMSLRPTVLIYADFWHLIPWPLTLDNYQASILNLFMPLLRTLFETFLSIFGILALACPAAYAFARMRFIGKQLFFSLVIAVLMIPGVILLTPSFILANVLNLRGSLWGLIFFNIGGGLPFAIFLITTFLRSQPEEMFGAARIDGASDLQILLRISIPLAIPILVTVGILNFLNFYSDLIWPSLMLPQSTNTLMMALQQFTPTSSMFANRPDVGVQTAGYVVATIPQLILFVVAMKYYIQGVMSSSLKA
ncbi:sugar ABC transporter permease [Dictyobacter alpinus]|uniref:Sugar ABC transporter permease n=1 Tax=Dictyobacter alpinus TaxID=2014873 RepID=A0A402BDM1_9CHLR|nr:carbohydrate ABC transporter permease [Dictyobacter alpinus]GCE29503.1 sugar ABC transporter permease [Dictyobacter alpinus]